MTAPTQAAPVRVLLVDDHAVVREGLAAILATDPGFHLVGAVGAASEAIALVGNSAPDLVLLDLLLGADDGLELLRQVKLLQPDLTVLMLSSVQDERPARAALALGAAGYVTKDIAADDLILTMKAALRGELPLSPRLDGKRVRRGESPPATPLSVRESDVLQLLAEGLANSEIAARLGIGEATVKTHVGNLLAKLGLGDRTQAAVYAWRHGLVRNNHH
jgi:DNA-binding NarL/FixJ family response regulator